ncbi:MAG: Ig-like domain repeat protein [Chloroflexi bacterium]|nr:Ig-like domain repeat protein [Chloroflexota bacterium]
MEGHADTTVQVNASPTATATSTPAATSTPVPTSTPTATSTPTPVDTTTNVTSSSNPSTYGSSVTFTAHVSSSGPTPTGNATFTIDGATAGTVALNGSGDAAYTTSSLAVGLHTVSATYGGDSRSKGSSGSLSGGQTVNKATPTINWSNPAAITYGTRLSATQLSASTSVGGTFSYSPVSGTALSAGSSQALQVTFNPSDSSNYNSNSATVYINVDKAPLTITATDQFKTYGATADLGATAFISNGLQYSDSLSSVTLTSTGAISTAVAATYAIAPSDAVGSGLSNYNISYVNGTLTVNKAGTTTSVVVQPFSIDVDADQDSSVYGYPVMFTATVSANSPVPAPPTGVVTFTFDNLDRGAPVAEWAMRPPQTQSVVTGTLSNGIASGVYAWLGASDTVSHSVDVNYGGDGNFLTSYGSLAGGLMVDQDSTTVAVGSSARPSVYGESVTFRARVSANSPGDGTPTGTATFYIDDSSATSPLVDGVATYTTSTLAVGTHPVQAHYSGDNNFFASRFWLVGGQTVNQDTTQVGISSSANPSTYSQSITLTATVSADEPGSGTPTGAVTFTIDGSTVATSSLANGVATYVTSTLTAVSHPVAVAYSGDGNFIDSSGSSSQLVNRANPVITWANPAAIPYGTPLSATQLDATGSVPGTFTYNPLAGTVLGAGAGQTLTATLAPSDTLNYNTVTQTASITITQVPLTITADSKSMTYGGPAPSLTYTATGFVNNDTVASLTTAPTLTTVPFTSVVGSYAITPSNAVDPNYAFTYVTGTLSIGTAPLTITAANQSKTYGATANLGATAFTPSGLQFSDSVGSVTLTSTGAISTAVAATYAITPSNAVGSGLSNYTITFDNGTLTVDKAGTTASVVVQPSLPNVHADWQSSVYGYPVMFTATVSANSPVPAPPTGVATFTFGDGAPHAPVAELLGLPPSQSIVTGTLSNGVATGVYAWLGAAGLPHTVDVNYGGDGNFLSSDGSLAGGVRVDRDGTNVVVTSSANASSYGETVVLTATVNANWPGGGTPTGTVVFHVDGAPTTIFLPNGVATYTMAAPSVGTHPVSVDYSGDSNFIFSSGSLSGGQVVARANPTITWANPADIVYGTALSATQLNATASVSGTFVYTPALGTVLSPGASQPLTVTFTPTDAEAYNVVTRTVYITVTAPNLGASTESASPAAVTPGGSVTYTIVLSNSGDGNASSARVTDTLPAGLTYTSSSATSGTPAYGGGAVTWTGAVSAGSAVTLTISVSVDVPRANGTIITNTVSIDDGYGTITDRSAAVTITSAPDLSGSSVTASATNVAKGDLLTYTITVTDTGTDNAPGASVVDALPSQLTFVSASASSGPVPTFSGSSLNWSGAVTVGTPVTISISATVNNSVPNNSSITNTVVISDGVGSRVSRSAAVYVLPAPVSGNVYPIGGGTITGTLSVTGGTTVAISFPTGAVSQTITVVFTPTLSCPAGSLRVLDNCFLLEAHDNSGNVINHFTTSYTITVHYTAADIVGTFEDSLRLYYYNEASSQWVALATTVDKVNKILTATVDHTTRFTVMGNTQYRIRLFPILKNYPLILSSP